MATAKDVAKKALRYCGESTNFSSAPDEDYNDALDEINNVINSWYELGLQLGGNQYEITNINEPLSYPRFAIDAMEYAVAVGLWPLYNIEKPLPMILAGKAQDSDNKLFTLAGANVNSVFPGNLPQGSGDWYVYRNNYYPNLDEPIYPSSDTSVLTENGSPVITENNND